jgi:hypothetical protein
MISLNRANLSGHQNRRPRLPLLERQRKYSTLSHEFWRRNRKLLQRLIPIIKSQ